jgi:rhamnosyltransferase
MENVTSPEIAVISVVIPALNGEAPLAELLASLRIQTVDPHEILVLDSSSSDNSAAVASSYGAQVHMIDRLDFDHGGTRSYGARCATGEIVVFLTQDVILAHRRVLELLVRPLLEDDGIAISYGRQLPTFDANPIAAHLRHFNYPPASSCRSFADHESQGLATIFNSNSCAAYRKADLAAIDFFHAGLIFGEDTLAAGQLLKSGKKIAYSSEATVYHSHNYEWGEEFSRYFDIGVLHAEQRWLLDTYGTTAGRGKRYVSSGVSYLYKRGCYGLIPDFMVRVVLKLCGYQLGKRYKRFPARLAVKLSMNKNWWNPASDR